MPRRVEISHKTIIFTALFLLSLWFLYVVQDIIIQLFVAVLITAILDPLVTKLSKFRIPRGISVFVTYVLFFVLFGLAVAGVVPPLIEQTTSFANGLPAYLENLGVPPFVSDQAVSELVKTVGALPGQVLKVGFSLFSNLLAILTVLTFAFYLLVTREKLEDQLGIFFGEERKKQLGDLIDKLEERLGGWARGELFLMLVVGTLTYSGLYLLGIPFALPLALLAGLLEIVPYIGPIIAAVPAVLIGFGISPVMGLATLALAFLIQQIENYVIVPKIMEKSVGVSPIIVLLALAIGSRLAGVVGILISVPVVITLQVFVSEYLFSRKSS